MMGQVEVSDTSRGTLSWFCAELAQLRSDAGGPTLRELSRIPGVPSVSQLSDVFGGKIRKPPGRDVVRLLVLACLDHAGPRPLRGPRSVDHWLARYDDLAMRWELRPKPTAAEADSALFAAPVGRWSPFSLGVHRAITVNGSRAIGPAPLTPYISRRHDAQLRRLLTGCQTSVMAVLVGESSTGKTRSMLEAVRACVPDWPLSHPVDAETLITAIGRVRSPLVLWLNEAQRYLDGPAGAQAARALHRLLSMPPGPVVVLGSMWLRQHWDRLTRHPRDGMPDPHHEVRELLLGLAHRIDVPSTFDEPAAHSTLELQTRRDQRLAVASNTAHGGRVIQVLAGGVALANQYAHPTDPYGHALLSAAIDARRLGYRSLLPEVYLRDAAPGYLSPQDRGTEAAQTGQWFADALTYAQGLAYGVAALTPERARAGMGAPDGFQLHDYLDQHGSLRRRSEPIPATTWDSLTRHTTSMDDRCRVIEQAAERGQFRHAYALYEGLSPNLLAPGSFPKYLHRTGRLPPDVGGQYDFSMRVITANSGDMSRSRRIGAGSATHRVDIVRLIRWLEQEGRYFEIEHALRHAVLLDLPGSDDRLVEWLDREGRTTDGDLARREAFSSGRPHACDRLVDRLLAAERQEEAEEVLRQAIDQGIHEALYRLLNVLHLTGRDAAVAHVLVDAVTAGHIQALGKLVDLQRAEGRYLEAEKTLRHAVLIGHTPAFSRLVVFLRQEGRQDEADQAWRYGLTAEGDTSTAW
jgi:tetratricopeptide (TPR) repeat protein